MSNLSHPQKKFAELFVKTGDLEASVNAVSNISLPFVIDCLQDENHPLFKRVMELREIATVTMSFVDEVTLRHQLFLIAMNDRLDAGQRLSAIKELLRTAVDESGSNWTGLETALKEEG